MAKWDEEENADEFTPEPWLAEVLSAAAPVPAPDEAFRGRCRAAGAAALTVATLRKERQRVGFVPLPLAEYIHGLVKLAETPLAPVFAWLGVTDLASTERRSVRAAARLAREVGMSAREALAHLRIGFAAQAGSAPVSLLVARHRSAGRWRAPLEEYEDALEEIEGGYDLDSLRKLRDLRSEVGAAYK